MKAFYGMGGKQILSDTAMNSSDIARPLKLEIGTDERENEERAESHAEHSPTCCRG